jgi:hypothetical protein
VPGQKGIRVSRPALNRPFPRWIQAEATGIGRRGGSHSQELRVLCVRHGCSRTQAMISHRLEARVRRDFGPSEADVVLTVLAELCPDLNMQRRGVVTAEPLTRRGSNAF